MFWFILNCFLVFCSAEKQYVTRDANITISVKGNIEDGCRYIFEDNNDIVACCFASRKILCGTGYLSTCRSDVEYQMQEMEGQCILHLNNVQHSDGGSYMAMFPANEENNMDVTVIVSDGEDNFTVIITVIIVIVVVLVVIVACLIFFLYYWQKRKTGVIGKGEDEIEQETGSKNTVLPDVAKTVVEVEDNIDMCHEDGQDYKYYCKTCTSYVCRPCSRR